MKILSTFNTNLERDLVEEYGRQFGDERVMSVHKSRLFYWKYVGLPITGFVILFIIGVYFFFREETIEPVMLRSFVGLFGLLGLTLFFRVTRKWVDYKMDFLIVTPREIVRYDQSGMFNRQIEKLHADKIKSVSISKPGFVNSVFDIGSITFMAEGDNDKGDITMEFVDAVEAQERKIVRVLGMDRD